jgi:hypothetical protein
MRMKSILTTVVLFAAFLGTARNSWGQPAPSEPRIGFFISHDQALRPLYGLPANVMVSGALSRTAGRAAFSNAAGLVQVSNSVLL